MSEQQYLSVDQAAAICHEANRALCIQQGDFSQAPWHAAPQWQQQSAINGVNFHLDNPEAKPEDSHRNWYNQKFEEGWKYGPVKDVNKKEHPCMVEYEHLPAEQRSKDFLFKSIIDGLREFIHRG